MFISTIINLCIYYSILFGSIECLNFCDNWNQYNEFKCLKVIGKKTTEEEALKLCTEMDKRSTLVTIHSKDEQQFLNKILSQYNNISSNVWIGMKYLNQSYRWMDGTDTNYTNWSDDAVKDGRDECVQMSLVGNTLNKWTDISCKKQALVVCQKNPERNLESLEKIISNLSKNFEKQSENYTKLSEHFEKKMSSLISNVFPLGFLYTQLPNQSSPELLWPSIKWGDVTKNYSGLFFRAEGEGSAEFGQIQQANQSWISSIETNSFTKASWSGETQLYEDFENFKNNETINKRLDATVSVFTAIYGIGITRTAAEIRPRNTAIKIWKRIE